MSETEKLPEKRGVLGFKRDFSVFFPLTGKEKDPSEREGSLAESMNEEDGGGK